MAKKIQFDVEAREGLKKGVDALANAVKEAKQGLHDDKIGTVNNKDSFQNLLGYYNLEPNTAQLFHFQY